MTPDQLKMGLRVRANREFSGVPQGTEGNVYPAGNSWPDTDSVAIHWERYEEDVLIDWFSFSDLQYLDVVEG